MLAVFLTTFCENENRIAGSMIVTQSTAFPCRFLTHNIRHETSSPFEGEQLWAERRDPLLRELVYHTRNLDAFVCLQEVLHSQLVDIENGLAGVVGEQWEYIGVGRDDGLTEGEYSPIFYRPAVWNLRHWETVWLSETPEVPSKGWDASSIRIVTIGVFTHRIGGHTVLLMNTHFDDQGSLARSGAAHLVLRKTREYQQGLFGHELTGVFLAGDLNSEQHQEAYQVLTSSHSPLLDTASHAPGLAQYGDWITWTGFGHEPEPPSRLDYVFLSRQSPWRIQGHAVLPNRFEDGVFLSDHRAVVLDVAKV